MGKTMGPQRWMNEAQKSERKNNRNIISNSLDINNKLLNKPETTKQNENRITEMPQKSLTFVMSQSVGNLAGNLKLISLQFATIQLPLPPFFYCVSCRRSHRYRISS